MFPSSAKGTQEQVQQGYPTAAFRGWHLDYGNSRISLILHGFSSLMPSKEPYNPDLSLWVLSHPWPYPAGPGARLEAPPGSQLVQPPAGAIRSGCSTPRSTSEHPQGPGLHNGRCRPGPGPPVLPAGPSSLPPRIPPCSALAQPPPRALPARVAPGPVCSSRLRHPRYRPGRLWAPPPPPPPLRPRSSRERTSPPKRPLAAAASPRPGSLPPAAPRPSPVPPGRRGSVRPPRRPRTTGKRTSSPLLPGEGAGFCPQHQTTDEHIPGFSSKLRNEPDTAHRGRSHLQGSR